MGLGLGLGTGRQREGREGAPETSKVASRRPSMVGGGRHRGNAEVEPRRK
jgi:hypothetical protein